MEEQKSYARLKHLYYEIDNTSVSDDLLIDIQKDHLIVDLIMPEIAQSVQDTITVLNLKPYELAVSKFTQSPYLFDVMQINSPGNRTIKGMQTLISNTNNTNGKCPIIIVYLEFQQS